MKKWNWNDSDRKYFKIATYVFCILAAVVLFEKIIGNLPDIGASIAHFLKFVQTLCLPILMGFMIAYLMNPFVNFFERHTMKKDNFFAKYPRITRAIAIILIYGIVIGGLIWIVIYIVPEIKDSSITFINQLPNYITTLNSKIEEFFLTVDFIDGAEVNRLLNRILSPLLGATSDLISSDATQGLAGISSMLTTIIGNVVNAGRFAFNIIMAVFIAFYMLFDKENFLHNIRKFVYAFTSDKLGDRIFYNAHRIHHIFQDFIVGKALDSLIIGILAFVGLSIIDAPLVLVLSVIIGITNMIPYFGPLMGGIPSVIITLLISPIDAIWVGLFILALQQFDGNVLGPKILGDSLEISPLWIIVAVIVGGALLGPLGMFIGVPIFAIIKLFVNEAIDRRYEKKHGSDVPHSEQ